MGKSKLTEIARKNCYEHVDDETEEDIEDEEEETEVVEEDMYIIDTASIIRERLIEYVVDGAYPLCEYLNHENILNFVDWLLTQN